VKENEYMTLILFDHVCGRELARVRASQLHEECTEEVIHLLKVVHLNLETLKDTQITVSVPYIVFPLVSPRRLLYVYTCARR
jgi:hypothetical protein